MTLNNVVSTFLHLLTTVLTSFLFKISLVSEVIFACSITSFR